MMILLLIKLLLLLRLRPRFREVKTFLTLVEHREGPEEIAGAAALVGVADELRVELLVPLQRDAALLLVILLRVTDREWLLFARCLDRVGQEFQFSISET